MQKLNLNKTLPILPSRKNVIGILGGGQLGKMTAMAAKKMGFTVFLYCPKGDNPAESVVDKIYHGEWNDKVKIDDFASKVSCVTSEFENIPSNVLQIISDKTLVFPNSETFKCAQFRDKEKTLATKVGFNVAKWYKIKSIEDLLKYGKCLNYKGILKTNSLGYDGKGQFLINSKNEINEIWQSINFSDCILEEKIDFKREISILYGRSANKTDCFFPISQNFHEKGILKKTIAPTSINEEKLIDLKNLVKKFSNVLNLVGLLTFELFELSDGTLIFNEIAPRPHNSFHWSIEGCDNSQFEILVRCLCGLKIKDTNNNGKWEMYNLIGNEINDLKNLIDDQKYSYHIYGKKIVKNGRKMGHFTKRS